MTIQRAGREEGRMDIGSSITAIGASVAAIAGAAALAPRFLPRVKPNTQGVMLRKGHYELDPDIQLAEPLRYPGVDDAKVYAERMRFVPWPYKELQTISTNERRADFKWPVTRRGVQYEVGAYVKWRIIVSERHGINYAARADAHGQANLDELVEARLAAGLNQLYLDETYSDASLRDIEFLTRNLRALSGGALLYYGARITEVGNVTFTETPAAILRGMAPEKLAVLDQASEVRLGVTQ